MKTFEVWNGEVNMTDDRSSSYNDGWMSMFQEVSLVLIVYTQQLTRAQISALLPDVNIVINHRDEPRVAFDARIPHAQSGALNVSDATPFRHAPRPTSKYYKDEEHCLVPSESKGFMTYANDANSCACRPSVLRETSTDPRPAVLLYSASADFTTDLYPVLSQSKIYPCFSDILFPSEVRRDPRPCALEANFYA